MQTIRKPWLIFDCEVFPNWWCFVFSDLNKNIKVITSENFNKLELFNIISSHILVGFNIKNYDLKILDAIMGDNNPNRLYKLSKSIIDDTPDVLNNIYFWNKYMFSDLFDDWKNGSLKEFESNIGMDIKESDVSFDKEKLTAKDIEDIIFYCKHDVEATIELFKEREEYLNAKIELAKMFNIPVFKALKCTNAKLSSIILKAVPIERPLETKYVLPEKVKDYVYKNLPEEIIKLFETLNFEEKSVKLFDNEITFGIGGIHSILSENIYTKTNDKYQLINVDVTSYYPNLLMHFNYMSRNVPDPKVYSDIYVLRKQLKKQAQEELATNGKTDKYKQLQSAQTGLKLILNTVYGATKNKYNALYDPYMAGSLCYTGQILLAALANKLYNNIKDLKVIQTNTDGILVKVPKEYIEKLKAIVSEWESMVGFTMEYDYVDEFYQRDVNNYIEVTGNPKDPYKLKGKWSNQADIDAVETNLNAPITHLAILNYYTKNIPVEKTIYDCKDISHFCFTTKTGRTYKQCYYNIKDDYISVNKVNRVIATTDTSKGSLYKYKPLEESEKPNPFLDDKKLKEFKKKEHLFINKYHLPIGRMDKIAEIPEHCELINDSLEDSYFKILDKDWYINFTKNKILELTNV